MPIGKLENSLEGDFEARNPPKIIPRVGAVIQVVIKVMPTTFSLIFNTVIR